ncbi:MAG: signal recognition particle-docking protein FtsY [Kiritimatiellia bacterium]
MARWIDALVRTRKNIADVFGRILSRTDSLDTDSLDDLEDHLIGADIAPRLAAEWVDKLQRAPRGHPGAKKTMIREMLLRHLDHGPAFKWRTDCKPHSILLVGVNGSGKTTTAARLAKNATMQGLTPLLAATDTFRAAGADQLKLWADRIGCDAVAGASGADAAAVAYDALEAAIARKADALIVDTAGRMHTQAPLMQELQKISRSLSKRMEGAPHETWIVLDAALGQNALSQARIFNDAVPLTGAIVTKLDGSSKGGFIFSIRQELGIPIHWVGLGEGEDDLAPFSAEEFVDALLETKEEP